MERGRHSLGIFFFIVSLVIDFFFFFLDFTGTNSNIYEIFYDKIKKLSTFFMSFFLYIK